MKTAVPAVLLREGHTPEDLEELTNVWRDAVEATHHFLPLKTIDRLEPRVRDECLPSLKLQVAERRGCILGFIGMEKHRLAMLFMADETRSIGTGSTLLEWAKSQSSRISLDVNAQNPRAAVFYIKRGFTVVGRSEVDARGCPFPLLHMSWKAAVADLLEK